MAIANLHKTIRFARVIDVMRTVATAAAVQAPTAIDVTDAQDSTVAAALRSFEIRDALACVFRNLPASRKKFSSKAPSAVD